MCILGEAFISRYTGDLYNLQVISIVIVITKLLWEKTGLERGQGITLTNVRIPETVLYLVKDLRD